MIARAEHQKEPPLLRRAPAHHHRHPHEHDAPDDGRLDDLAYVAKLRHSGRPRKLAGAVLLLLLAMRRVERADPFALRLALTVPVAAVATQIASWLSASLGVPVSADAIRASLLASILDYSAKAGTQLSGDALAARLGLIVQAETQRATAAAVARVAPQLQSITRDTTSSHPCDPCLSLEGTYSPPYPADLYWTHPRCACVWYPS